jgi:hypothetical protein
MAEFEGEFLERVASAKAQGFLMDWPPRGVRHDSMQCDCRHEWLQSVNLQFR